MSNGAMSYEPPPYSGLDFSTTPATPPPSYEEATKTLNEQATELGEPSPASQTSPVALTTRVGWPSASVHTPTQVGVTVPQASLSNVNQVQTRRTTNADSSPPRTTSTSVSSWRRRFELRECISKGKPSSDTVFVILVVIYGLMVPVVQISVVAEHGLKSCPAYDFIPTHQLAGGLAALVVGPLLFVRVRCMEKLNQGRYYPSNQNDIQKFVNFITPLAVMFIVGWTFYGTYTVYDSFTTFRHYEVTTAYTPTTNATSLTVTTTFPTTSTMFAVTTARFRTTTFKKRTPKPSANDCNEAVLYAAVTCVTLQILPFAIVVLAFFLNAFGQSLKRAFET